MGNINFNLSPMNKGMIRNTPVNKLLPGAFHDLNGAMVHNGNLRIRPRWIEFNGYSAYDTGTYKRMVDGLSFTDNVSTQEIFVFTENAVLKDSGTEYIAQSITRAAGTDTTPFIYRPDVSIQWTIGRDSSGAAMWCSDGSNPLIKYAFPTNTWSEVFTSYGNVRSVLYHDSRLWLAGPTTSQGTMLRWSNLNDPDTFDAINYMYFPERTHPITKIKAMGQFLVIYFPDAVYVGQASGNPLVPYTFTDSNVELVGLKGPHAVADWRNGHVFISRKGIFWLRPDRVVEELPCPVFEFLIQSYMFPQYFYIVSTDLSEDLYLAVPGENTKCSRIFHYSAVDNAWAYWDTEADGLFVRQPETTLDWDNGSEELELPDGTVITEWLGATNQWAANSLYGWDDMVKYVSEISPSVFVDGKTYVLSESAPNDDFSVETGTYLCLETGDIDFNEPDMNKTFHRMRLRSDLFAGEHPLTLSGSIDGGRTWKILGEWTQDSTDESLLNFRLTGAECRLRISGRVSTATYELKDLTFRARGRGLETT